jgi:hypothetical protein
MSNKRNKGDDTPQTPLLRRSARHNRNTPVSYSESQRKQLHPSVATATTPFDHTAGRALTSLPVNDQRQLKTIEESHDVPSDVPPANVGGSKSPNSDSEIVEGPIVPELGKDSVFDPNKTNVTQLNMGFATLFLHVTITKISDRTTGKERRWVMFSDICTNARDIKFDRIMKEDVDKLVIAREHMSLIFYEEAPTISVVLTDMIDGTKVVPNFLAGSITSERIAHMKQVREQVFAVLNTQPKVTEEAWCTDSVYDKMLLELKIVMDKKPSEVTPLKQELMYWN